MKKILCIVTSVILAGWHDPLTAQKVAPLVGMDYNVNGGWVQPLNQFNLHAGIVYNERLVFEVHEGVNNLVRSAECRKFHYWSTSFSGTFRLMPIYKLSPVLCLTAGFGSPYNGDSVYVKDTKFIAAENKPYSYGVFDKVSGFGSVQLGVDRKMDRWHLQLTGGLNSVRMHTRLWNPPNALLIVKHLSWIASVSLSYELRFEKK